jgi:hypothetical protein
MPPTYKNALETVIAAAKRDLDILCDIAEGEPDDSVTVEAEADRIALQDAIEAVIIVTDSHVAELLAVLDQAASCLEEHATILEKSGGGFFARQAAQRARAVIAKAGAS